MPLTPHYPSDDPDDPDEAPDLNEVINRILNDPDEVPGSSVAVTAV